MAGTGIPAIKNRIFKTHAALAGEIVLLDKAHHLRNGPGLLHGHHFFPLFREGVVQAHRQVALALIQVFLKFGQYADGAEGNALRAPGQAPVGRKHLYDPLYVFPIVQRLPHSHEYGVGEFPGLFNGEKLVQDICGAQVAVEALSARHTELAGHLTACLGTDTQGLALFVRNHHRLYERVFFPASAHRASYRKQILPGAVLGGLHIYGGHIAHLITLRESFPAHLGEVGHLIEGLHPLLVQPLCHLLPRKSREAGLQCNRLQFIRRFTQQAFFHGFPFESYKYTFFLPKNQPLTHI